MKRLAIRCSKMKALARELKIPHNHAIGIMEHLWNWTADQHPEGDIGKDTDSYIQDEVAPELRRVDLIPALIKVGFLDEVDLPVRLYVHDWHAHADVSVRKLLSRHGLSFANGCDPRCYSLKDKTASGQPADSQVTASGQPADSQVTASGQPADSQRLAAVCPSRARGLSLSLRQSQSLCLSLSTKSLSGWIELVRGIRPEFRGFPDHAIARALQADAPVEVIDSAVNDFCMAMDPALCIKLPMNPVMTLGRFVQEACRRWSEKNKNAQPGGATQAPYQSDDDAEFEGKWGERRHRKPADVTTNTLASDPTPTDDQDGQKNGGES